MQTDLMRTGSVIVDIYPELLAEAIKRREEDLYIAWSILRACAKQRGGSGVWSVHLIRGVIAALLGIGESQTYARVQAGIDKYWNSPGGALNKRRTGIFSIRRIAEQLQHATPASPFFKVPIDDLLFHQSRTGLRNFALQMVASRNGREKPVSIATIAEITGLSKTTVKRALRRNAGAFCAQVNVAVLHTFVYEHEAREALRRLSLANPKTALRYFVISDDKGEFHLVERKPNSYFMNGIERGKIHKRPKILRDLDIAAGRVGMAKKYCRSSERMGRVRQTVNYVPRAVVGSVQTWEPVGTPELAEEIISTPSSANRVSRYAAEKRWLEPL